MSKKDQYPVSRYTGLPVEDDGNGGYQLHYDANGQIRLHTWRTGKSSQRGAAGTIPFSEC